MVCHPSSDPYYETEPVVLTPYGNVHVDDLYDEVDRAFPID